jgi:PAS domain S-box-containing protein
METLQQLPALVVLERFPVPVLAIGEGGEILFANTAFGEMLGYSTDALRDLGFQQIFRTMLAEESAVTVLRAHAGLIVELEHSDGSIVRANMSKSALLRGNDQFALAVFQDLTEQLWVDEV